MCRAEDTKPAVDRQVLLQMLCDNLQLKGADRMKKKSVFMGMIAISALVWMTGCAGRAVESSDIETEQEEKDGSGETETDVISIDGDKLKVMASSWF